LSLTEPVVAFDLRYYAECQDLDYLLGSLDTEKHRGKQAGKMRLLNKAMVELIEEYGMVNFETLAVEVRQLRPLSSTMAADADPLSG
jgi:hypothetical protein